MNFWCFLVNPASVEVWQEVRVICSQEVTAMGRLEYLAPLRLAGMHTQMNLLSQAYKAHMPNPSNMTDPCTLSKLKARAGKEGISNDRTRGAEFDPNNHSLKEIPFRHLCA